MGSIMSEIGHNNPPEAIELASQVVSSISSYMADNPVVESEQAARDMKLSIDRAKLCIKDLEAERDGKVRPLNDQVAAINNQYRPSRRMLGDLLDEMLRRVQVFVKAEEQRRSRIAMEAAIKAKEAERLALEAERIERERLDDVAKGEVGIDVAETIAKADQAFEDYQRAERQADIAERDTKVKIGGGLSRAIGLREKETLIITNHVDAIYFMGMTQDIQDAILKSARAFRRLHGRLPNGILSQMEKHL
jgi:hypothetical protein